MRSLIIFLISVAELVSRCVSVQAVAVRGDELLRIMTLAELPTKCQETEVPLVYAHVSIFPGGSPSILVCHKTFRTLGLQLITPDGLKRFRFQLNDAGEFTKMDMDASNPTYITVDYGEMFDAQGEVFEPGTKSLDESEIQQVNFFELNKTKLTRLFRIVSKLCASICDVMDPTNTEVLPVYSDADFDLSQFLVDCAKKTISLVKDEDRVEVFVGLTSPGIPIIYNWRSRKYLNDVSEVGERWVSIMHHKMITETPTRLFLDHLTEAFTIPLNVLTDVIGVLTTHILSSPMFPYFRNKQGAVLLANKVIVRLTHSSIPVLGQVVSMMEVEGVSNLLEGQGIYFNDNKFFDYFGQPCEGQKMINTQRLSRLSNDIPFFEDYVDVKTFQKLTISQLDFIQSLRKDYGWANNLPVTMYGVYQGRSFFRAQHKFIDKDIYYMENFLVMTAHKDDDEMIASEYKYDSIYFLPLFHGGTFLSLTGRPMAHNMLAVRLTHFVDESLLNTGERGQRKVLRFKNSWEDWELIFDVPV